MDILRMLEQLHDVAVEQPRHFGPITWGFNAEEVAMQIVKIRASLPAAVKEADHVTKDSDRILEAAREDARQVVSQAQSDAQRTAEEARKEADLTLERARLEQKQLVADHEVLRLAKAQCDEIRAQAERDAATARREADDYVARVLNHLELVLGKAVRSIEIGKQQLERGVTEIPVASAIVESRDKVRV